MATVGERQIEVIAALGELLRGCDAAIHLAHAGHRDAGWVDAVDARRTEQVADLDVGIASHEPQLHADAASAPEGNAACLGARVEHRDRGVLVRQQRQPRSIQGDLIAHVINFDIVVSTNDTDKAKGGVGIFVGEIGVGVRGEAESQSTAVNRIQFSVPVYLPTQKLNQR